ncbi:MAG: error-prone DNA polymerase [Pseudomonadota bacterium]|nr:error-prone DNA polymerase [Pseudomonadota bacterium]
MPRYAELQVTTNFSFLRGGSHAEELVAQAKQLGLAAIAITDRNTLAGIVRAHAAGKDLGFKVIVGVRLDLESRMSLLAYPRDRSAYGRLCQLLTAGQRRAEKGRCSLLLADVAEHQEGMIFVAVPPHGMPGRPFADELATMRANIKAPLYLAAAMLHHGKDRARLNSLAALARLNRTPLLATNDVLYHQAGRRPLQDVLTCIREKCTIHEAGYRLDANAERHLKTPAELTRLFKGHAAAVARTIEVADQCTFSLDELRYEYPDEPVPTGTTPHKHLEHLAWEGARERYPQGVPDKIKAGIVKELALIGRLRIAPYFLTVHDIVAFARSRDKPILCQGRGSAANSTVCYCLGITNVDPNAIELLFERFVSEERREPPDIDVDFEHERREEVIQYIYARYGRDRAGLAATVISYRGRSSLREVGKAMGLSEDVTASLAGLVWGYGKDATTAQQFREKGLDPEDPLLVEVLALARELEGFPRHLSQHVGGFVLTKGPLSETVPIGNAAMADRTVIEWDKDDIDALGIMKVDVLGLGMLTCIRKCFELMQSWYGLTYSLASLPREDPAVYDMLCKADSIGVFQVESRAQMNMLPRLRPRSFYDLVIEVAIVRPGPIQGDMVHPYLRRRDRLEPENYPAPHPACGPADELRQVLGRTKGVPLFQEQAMRLAMVAAKFSPSELNELRRAMATFRRSGTIGKLEEKMVSRMVARGYDPDFARRCFSQIRGFGEYGFPESHAASFAHLVYVSSWLKCHYPAVFAAALLNSQPMGFYAPAQIVRDAREHGVEVRHPDVTRSGWDSELESTGEPPAGAPALRLGLREVMGLGEDEGRAMEQLQGRFGTITELQRRAGISSAALEKLAAADAFRSLGLDRRAALWQVKGLAKARPMPLFESRGGDEHGTELPVTLPDMPLSEHVVNDYQTIRMSLKGHPMGFLRRQCASEGVVDNVQLKAMKAGAFVSVAGVVLVRQRPGTAKGVVFITIEDEVGVCNIVVWQKVLEKYRAIVMGARLLLVRGRIERAGEIIHVVAGRIEDRTDWLSLLSEDLKPFANPLARADEILRPGYDRQPAARHPRQMRVIPKSRDFH